MKILVAILISLTAAVAAAVPTQRVGLPLEIRELYIPGGEISPTPRRDRKPPLAVRILEVKPAKDGFRYDFEVQGLEPGTHNLADFLDAPPGTTIPAIPVEITSALPPGVPQPHPAAPGPLPALGGYRAFMTLLATAWFTGLILIVLWRKNRSADATGSTAAPTLADRLKPLLTRAAAGNLTTDERARLERLIIGHWHAKLPELIPLSPAESLAALRTHPEASPMILALERWLHARNSTTSEAEIDQLLAPYRSPS